MVGLNAQGYDLELRQFPTGWRANLYPTGTAHSIVVASGMGSDTLAGGTAGGVERAQAVGARMSCALATVVSVAAPLCGRKPRSVARNCRTCVFQQAQRHGRGARIGGLEWP